MPSAIASWAIVFPLIHPGCAQDASRNIGVGASILCPESITGAWEERLKSGDTFGLAIGMLATVPGTTQSLSSQNKRLRFIRVETYLRHDAKTKRTLWYTGLNGNFSWRGDRLRLYSPGPDFTPSLDPFVASVDLDLTFDRRRDEWTGSVHSLGLAEAVNLARSSRTEPEAPTGVWQEFHDTSHVGCLHVMMGDDGQLVLWADYLSVAEPAQYATLAAEQFPPSPIDESYGEFLSDSRTQHTANHWLFSEGNGLWREDLNGELDPNGTVFAGTFNHYGNGFVVPGPRAFRWERIPGNCGG